jgi:2-keto-3-deoxy-L-rhamnonate aldolase RhmA
MSPVIRLRRRLAEGGIALGAVVSINSPEVAAHLSGLGFDFIWIEMEHGSVTREGLRNMILATRGFDITPLARPPVNELWTAKVLLDQGAMGVIFPFTRSAELAKQAVDACRYPPLGRRGSGAQLAQLRWPPAKAYYDAADENILVVAVVEDLAGLENIDAIAATPGLDVLFIGTGDLSWSLGLRGDQHHPKLAEAVGRIAAAGKKHGKILGRPAGTPAEVERYRVQGFQFFMTATEIELIAAGAQALLEPLGRKPAGGMVTPV